MHPGESSIKQIANDFEHDLQDHQNAFQTGGDSIRYQLD
jgi:aryl carrier-like protein